MFPYPFLNWFDDGRRKLKHKGRFTLLFFRFKPGYGLYNYNVFCVASITLWPFSFICLLHAIYLQRNCGLYSDNLLENECSWSCRLEERGCSSFFVSIKIVWFSASMLHHSRLVHFNPSLVSLCFRDHGCKMVLVFQQCVFNF